MDSLDDWIAREAIGFSLEDAAAFETAVARMVAALGDDVQLLGFGEALHGGEELLLLRNRLFLQLAAAHGYSAIAVESSFPRSRLVNEFVAVRGASSFDDVRESGFSHGFGRLAANRELVEAMRRQNAERPAAAPLRFYGFDAPMEMAGAESPRGLLQFVLDYLAEIDGDAVQELRGRLNGLFGDDAAWENPAAMYDPAKSIGLSPNAAAARLEVEDLFATLQVRRPELAAIDDDRYREAAHYARQARQLLAYHAEMARNSGDRFVRLLGIRDAMMADNLSFIARRERGRGKVLVFAHNAHLQRGRARWQWGPNEMAWWPAGAHLAAKFGRRYAVIGTGVGVSEANGIGPPEPGTLEARLMALPGAVKWIPTHRGGAPWSDEAAALPVRTGSKKNGSYFPLTPQSLRDFDWFAVVNATDYNRGGPPLP